MTSLRSLPPTVGGLFAVALLAGAPLTSAYATDNSAYDNQEPNIYAPPTPMTVWGVPRTSIDDGLAMSSDGRLASLCPQALADPGAFSPRIVAECEGGPMVR